MTQHRNQRSSGVANFALMIGSQWGGFQVSVALREKMVSPGWQFLSTSAADRDTRVNALLRLSGTTGVISDAGLGASAL